MQVTLLQRMSQRQGWSALVLLLMALPTAAPPETSRVIQGELRTSDPLDAPHKQSHCKVHEVALLKDQTILVHLRSIDFDPLLRVEDAQGKVLGQNDDIGPNDQNSRLGFVAPRAGTYRLVVTSPPWRWVGPYRLEVVTLQPAGEPERIQGELTDRSPLAQGRRYEVHPVQTEPHLRVTEPVPADLARRPGLARAPTKQWAAFTLSGVGQ